MSNESYLIEKERGDELVERGEFTSAIVAYEAAIEQRPQFWGAYYFKGETLLKLDRFHDAAVAFWSASLYARGRPEPALMAGRSLFSAEFYIDACTAFESVARVSLDPDSALQYAICLLKCERAQDALDLEDKFHLSKNKSAIRLLLVDIYSDLKLFNDAKRIISEEIIESGDSHTNLDIFSRVTFSLGEIEVSEDFTKKSLNQLFIELENSHDVQKCGTISQFMPVPEAKIALKEICNILELNKITYFLDAGTLLGIARDGDLLPYDKDMDIGVFGDISAEKIYEIFMHNSDYEIKKARNEYEQEKFFWNIIVYNKTLEITTDIFFYHEVDGFLHFGFYNPSFPVLWRHSDFKLGRISFDGFDYSAPSNVSLFLEEMYGPNWRIADPFFQSVISAPNLHPKSTEISKVFGLHLAYTALSQGKFQKATEIFRQVADVHGDEFSKYATNVINSLR